VDVDNLKHLKVVDAVGTLLGTLRALDVDLTTGAPLRLSIHKGGLLRHGGETVTIAGAAIRSVGGDLITVAATVAIDDLGVASAQGVANVAMP